MERSIKRFGQLEQVFQPIPHDVQGAAGGKKKNKQPHHNVSAKKIKTLAKAKTFFLEGRSNIRVFLLFAGDLET
jgi:hypothetical protein